jgi:hypothetical protein
MKLGLLPHTPDERDVALTSVYTPTPERPDTFGATGLDWGVLGNDEWGDCYWASAAHEVMAEAHLAGRDPGFGTEDVLSTYASYLRLEGVWELTQRNDEGTDARAGAKYRKAHGVRDASGHAHHIGAYTFIEVPDYELIKSAVHDFEGITVCVNLPESAEDAFRTEGPKVWDYVKGSPILGGHAIAGTSVQDDKLFIVSWGEEVELTEAFVEKYLQTCVVYVSGSTLDGTGHTPAGLDRAALLNALKALA